MILPSQSPVRVPELSTIHGVIAAEAQRTPDAAAIKAPGRMPMSYGLLREHLESFTAQLEGLGIGRDDRVAVVLPNGPDMALAFLAISAAAACAPLNPAYGESELDFYLADLRASAVVLPEGAPSPARAAARRANLAVIELSPCPDEPAGTFQLRGDRHRKAISARPARPDDLALLLHTSGTTSRPKLVPLTHANLSTSAAGIGRTLELASEDCGLNVMPLFHIHGLAAALLASLFRGGSVICTGGFDATTFFTYLETLQPTWYTAVPTIHQAVLASAGENAGPLARHRLRFARSSSAPLPPQVMRGLEKTFGVPVIEAYGMTEASHQMCSNPLPPGARKPGSVGPAAGPEVALMDERGNLVAAGAKGEVVIRGPSVIQGYEDNPEANRTAVVAGWFRTGDQGYFDDDGYLYLSGRIKEMINRGSEKVAPREIDEVLLEHPAVSQAVAFAVPHATLGEDIVAAVVLRANARASPAEIRDLVLQRLAAFKVPSRIIIVDAIPKGPTGKIQRVGLAEKLAQELTTTFVAPQNEIDSLLADIWREVLGVQAVGMLDNFFANGGDSLRGMRVMARVNELFELQQPVAFIFRYPTLEQFSVQIGRIADSGRVRAIAQAMREVEGISDEEARQLLDAEAGSV